MLNKIQIEVLVESSKNCSRSRIVDSPYYGMNILVAVASDRANTVYIWTPTLITLPCHLCVRGNDTLVVIHCGINIIIP